MTASSSRLSLHTPSSEGSYSASTHVTKDWGFFFKFLEFLMTGCIVAIKLNNFICFWTLPLTKQKESQLIRKMKAWKAKIRHTKDKFSSSSFTGLQENKCQHKKGTTQDTEISYKALITPTPRTVTGQATAALKFQAVTLNCSLGEANWNRRLHLWGFILKSIWNIKIVRNRLCYSLQVLDILCKLHLDQYYVFTHTLIPECLI